MPTARVSNQMEHHQERFLPVFRHFYFKRRLRPALLTRQRKWLSHSAGGLCLPCQLAEGFATLTNHLAPLAVREERSLGHEAPVAAFVILPPTSSYYSHTRMRRRACVCGSGCFKIHLAFYQPHDAALCSTAYRNNNSHTPLFDINKSHPAAAAAATGAIKAASSCNMHGNLCASSSLAQPLQDVTAL